MFNHKPEQINVRVFGYYQKHITFLWQQDIFKSLQSKPIKNIIQNFIFKKLYLNKLNNESIAEWSKK